MVKTLQTTALSNPQATEFHAEHLEIPASPNGQRQAQTGDFVVASPYTSLSHLLDLRTLNIPQQLFAKALTRLEATRPDYATAPYIDSFNWAIVFEYLKDLAQQRSHTWQRQHFYIIVFRSQIPPTTDRLELGELDQRSHAEATKSGGLLKYWFGTPDENGRNLATCTTDLNCPPELVIHVIEERIADSIIYQGIWRQQSDARPASGGPGHKAAQRATLSMYSEWRIERLKLEIGDRVDERSIVAWEDGVD